MIRNWAFRLSVTACLSGCDKKPGIELAGEMINQTLLAEVIQQPLDTSHNYTNLNGPFYKVNIYKCLRITDNYETLFNIKKIINL